MCIKIGIYIYLMFVQCVIQVYFGICHTHKRYNLYNSELVQKEFVPVAYPKITLVVRNSLVVWTGMTKGFYDVLECMGIMMKPL